MFFKDIKEFQQYFPSASGMKLESFEPFYWIVADAHFKPLLGDGQWDALVAAYDTASGDLDALAPAQKNLIIAIRKPFALLSVYHYIPVGDVAVTANGFKVTKGNNQEIASQARVAKLEREILVQSYFGLDQLVRFLQENEDDYTDWKSSKAYQEMHRHFVRTVEEFERGFNIRRNRYVFWQMMPVMDRVEETRIRSLLGDTLFDGLITKMKAGTDLSAQETKLVNRIKPAVIHLTIADALIDLAVTIDNRGITLYSNDNSKTMEVHKAADAQTKGQIGQLATNRGESYLKQLETFLDKNHADYPDYDYNEEKTTYFDKDSDLPASIHF